MRVRSSCKLAANKKQEMDEQRVVEEKNSCCTVVTGKRTMLLKSELPTLRSYGEAVTVVDLQPYQENSVITKMCVVTPQRFREEIFLQLSMKPRYFSNTIIVHHNSTRRKYRSQVYVCPTLSTRPSHVSQRQIMYPRCAETKIGNTLTYWLHPSRRWYLETVHFHPQDWMIMTDNSTAVTKVEECEEAEESEAEDEEVEKVLESSESSEDESFFMEEVCEYHYVKTEVQSSEKMKADYQNSAQTETIQVDRKQEISIKESCRPDAV